MANNNMTDEEMLKAAGLDPAKWAAAPTQAPVSNAGGGPPVSGGNMFLSGSIDPSLQDQPPALIATQNTSLGTYGLMPIPPSGSAQANAGAISAVQGAITNGTIVIPPAPSGGEVSLEMPAQFSVAGSPGDDLVVSWDAVPPLYFLGGPGNTALGFDVMNTADGVNGSGAGAISITAGTQQSQTNEFALYIAKIQSSTVTGPPAGSWTAYSSGTNSVYVSNLGGSGTTAVQPISGTGQFAAMLMYFAGTAPALIQTNAANNGGIPLTLPFTSSVGGGNSALCVIQGFVSGGAPIPINVSDSQNQVPIFIGTVFTPNSATYGDGAFCSLYIIQNLTAGSESVTFTPAPPGQNATCQIFEIPAIPGLNALPSFRPLPGVNLSIDGNGGILPGYSLPVAHLGQNGANASASTFLSGGGTFGNWVSPNYQTVESPLSGPLPAQPALNFVDTFIVSNDAGNSSTDITNLAGKYSATNVSTDTAPSPIITGTTVPNVLYQISWYVYISAADVAGATLTITIESVDTTSNPQNFIFPSSAIGAFSGVAICRCSGSVSPTISATNSVTPTTLLYNLSARALPQA